MQDPSRRPAAQEYNVKDKVAPTNCPNCGAGLPVPNFASDRHVTCDYCGSVIHFGVPDAPAPPPAPPPAPTWAGQVPTTPHDTPMPTPTPINDSGPAMAVRIVLLVISFLWAFPVGLIIGIIYLNKKESGNKAFGKTVLMVVGLSILFNCIAVGFFSALGSASGS